MAKADKKDQEYLINYFEHRQSYKTMRVIEDGALQDILVIYVSI